MQSPTQDGLLRCSLLVRSLVTPLPPKQGALRETQASLLEEVVRLRGEKEEVQARAAEAAQAQVQEAKVGSRDKGATIQKINK